MSIIVITKNRHISLTAFGSWIKLWTFYISFMLICKDLAIQQHIIPLIMLMCKMCNNIYASFRFFSYVYLENLIPAFQFTLSWIWSTIIASPLYNYTGRRNSIANCIGVMHTSPDMPGASILAINTTRLVVEYQIRKNITLLKIAEVVSQWNWNMWKTNL